MTSRLSCSNDRCDDGWMAPLPSYVDHWEPYPDDPGEDASAAVRAEYDTLVELVTERRAAYANTVYPCKTCRPVLFFRWAGGHLTVGHDTASCEQCADVIRHRPIDIAALTHPEPLDDDDWTRSRKDVG